MSNTTLQAIRDKVRRITRTPSPSQLTDAMLDEYINTFLLYGLPEQLRLFSLRTVLKFYTQPYIDTYETVNTPTTDPLYDFKNKYVSVHQPIYIAGIAGLYTQRREELFGYYPQTNTIADTLLRGTGGVGPFTGTLSARPVLQRNVIFTCQSTLGTTMVLIDNPVNAYLGQLIVPNDTTVSYGQINYVTGAYTFLFPNNTLLGAIIYSETIPYAAAKPLMMLFFDNKFIVRPVPDKAYEIQLEADIRPTELLAANQSPQLNQWWEYIAFSASKKVFEDRLDYESIQLIEPSRLEQENLCIRSTLTTRANERTQTIYSIGKNYWGPGFGTQWPY